MEAQYLELQKAQESKVLFYHRMSASEVTFFQRMFVVCWEGFFWVRFSFKGWSPGHSKQAQSRARRCFLVMFRK